MAAFSQFSSDLDISTKKLLNRGARLTEMLKQPVYSPLPMEEEVVVLFAGSRGFLDDLELSEVKEFENFLLNNFRKHHVDYLKEIRIEKVISEELEAKLKTCIQKYIEEFKKVEKEEKISA
jgi:F-type H+-transporting ATPase subunit alpha